MFLIHHCLYIESFTCQNCFDGFHQQSSKGPTGKTIEKLDRKINVHKNTMRL